jgi:VWA domain containing CoxE-like protein
VRVGLSSVVRVAIGSFHLGGADRRRSAGAHAHERRAWPVVVICSDGLDVGEHQVLRAEMPRLSRLAHRIVWLNPLNEDPAYEPLARGMRDALPYVDVPLSGHNLASLEAIGEPLWLTAVCVGGGASPRRTSSPSFAVVSPTRHCSRVQSSVHGRAEAAEGRRAMRVTQASRGDLPLLLADRLLAGSRRFDAATEIALASVHEESGLNQEVG